MNPNTKVLEHLSYVLECVAISSIGEAKTELDRLVHLVESDASFGIENRRAVASQLRKALSLYQSGDIAHGSSTLGKLSRELWVAKLKSSESMKRARMNKAQRMIVLVAAIMIGAMLLVPPFEIPRLGVNAGYSFILLPPQMDTDNNALSFVNVKQLLAQWLGVLLAAGLFYWLAKSKD